MSKYEGPRWDNSDEKRHISKYDYEQLQKYVNVMRLRKNWGNMMPSSVFSAAEQRLKLLAKKARHQKAPSSTDSTTS